MSPIQSIPPIFRFFLRTGIRNRRTLLLMATAFIPAIILLVVLLVQLGNPNSSTGPVLFRQMAVPFLFQLFAPLLSLLFGSACVGDELDGHTLAFLTTRPAGKPWVLLGKVAALLALAIPILTLAIVVSLGLGFGAEALTRDGISLLGAYVGTGALTILAYSSLFVLFGTLLKKPVIAGVIFIFGWEYIVQFIPGSTQRLTISHYIKSLLPYKSSTGGGFLMFQLQASSTAHSIILLLLISVGLLTISLWVFNRREYVLSEPRI